MNAGHCGASGSKRYVSVEFSARTLRRRGRSGGAFGRRGRRGGSFVTVCTHTQNFSPARLMWGSLPLAQLRLQNSPERCRSKLFSSSVRESCFPSCVPRGGSPGHASCGPSGAERRWRRPRRPRESQCSQIRQGLLHGGGRS